MFRFITLLHVFDKRLLPIDYKQLNLELPFPESKLDVQNLPTLSCFSLKL